MRLQNPKPVTVDFETHGIEGRPHYPPVPVGVSIKYPSKKPIYYAWGHPTNNNCCWSEAKEALTKAWAWKDGILCQNGKFDVDVAVSHMEMRMLPWDKIHDTMFLLYLDDPHQTELSLKPSAERLLGMEPEEQDAVGDWLVEHQPVPFVKISKSKNSEHYFGRYIAYAPGDLVGKYANGDVIRTEKIFDLLWKKTKARKMLAAYDRERRLMPILLEMEQNGLPVDHKKLKSDVDLYNKIRDQITTWILKRIKADETLNLDSGEQLMQAMIKANKVDEDLIPRTPTGKYQTNKEALLTSVSDKVLLGMLKYRTQLNTCLNTFMQPWLKTADMSGGFIYTTWNQVKAPKGGGNAGTRTGRLSSTPNFQNIPKEFQPIWRHDKPSDKNLPICPMELPALPSIRSYVVPFDGDIIIDRDYSQQEPRILAHFDGGALMDKYLENPWIDFHDYAKLELERMGKFYDRKPVKNTNLGLIYGMGVGELAERNGMTVEESSELKKAILTLYPGLKEMYKDMKMLAKSGMPIRTWGGREYYCEEPKIVQGRLREFDYKMVNVLIQGSAADCTKEAIIRFHAVKDPRTKIILNVHDQISASAPESIYKTEMEKLRETMESIEFDVPMLSEGAISDESWGSLVDYDKKGVIL